MHIDEIKGYIDSSTGLMIAIPDHEDIEFLTYIQSSDSSTSTPTNPHHSLDTIALPLSPPSNSSSTKNIDQVSSSHSHSPTTSIPPLSLILEYFLSFDLTPERPDLEKYKEGYKNRRIIKSGDSYYLIDPEGGGIEGENGISEERDIGSRYSYWESDWKVYRLPVGHHGGERDMVHCYTFTPEQIKNFEKMLVCKYDPDNKIYPCGFCPKCRRKKNKGKLFVNQRAEIRRQEEIINDLKEWGKDKGYISKLEKELVHLQKSVHKHDADILGCRIERLKERIENPQTHILHARKYLKELQQEGEMLKDCAELSDEPHSFISICTPHPLNKLYKAQEAWFTKKVLKPSRETPSALRRILECLEGREDGFLDTLRYVFRYLVVEAVEKQHPDLELTYIQQMHPFNKYDLAPDMHFLVRNTVLEAGGIRDLSFDVVKLHKEVEVKMQTFADFVYLIIKRWNCKCTSTAFKKWRADVLESVGTIKEVGIPITTVRIDIRDGKDRLSTLAYLRKYPTQNIKRMEFDKDKGKVGVYYWQRNLKTVGKRAEIALLDFLWRLVGFDMRRFRVESRGDYLNNRVEKLKAYNDACGKSNTDTTESIEQVLDDRQVTADGGSLIETSEM